ncbi:hypothetical protein [Mucilaginibacter psychrotolerans]|uniref:Uncharacterized protein n=1 Tax=Mucilaginibacter psychrotolerans TaxID=1524096 RepID=A0A4Y8S7F1_9SPHI|nr:hypothetical protein [Mucilaginibacter psychrotolerans]TFF34397.1 hypothetical protein E2R66_22240 [Mucilaginibacter psychrotolerans]
MKLIDKLPTSYDQINYKTYVQILQTIPAEKPDEWDDDEYKSYLNLAPLSILLDVPVIDLERLPATELMPMLQRVQFMAGPIKNAKTSLSLKAMDELTYDEFVTYQSLKVDAWANMPRILKMIVKDKTAEEIDQLSISEVYAVFFTLSKSTKRFTTLLIRSLALKMVKQTLMMLWRKVKLMLTNLFLVR